ncbi:MAG TPA: diacylglycerol kinase family protein [Ktedonobacterales bacterium]
MSGERPIARDRAVLIYSEHAGHSAALTHAESQLAAAGISVAERIEVGALPATTAQGPIWRDAGIGLAIGAGGDGTLGTVATHLLGSDLALGILPMGTSNDVARSLGIPLDIAAAVRVLREGEPTVVDAGQVVSEAGASLSPVFLHVLALGLNVEFARLATSVVTRREFGRLSYAVSSVEALGTFEPVETRLHLSGCPEDQASDLTLTVMQVAVVNTPVFGGSLELRVPGISVRDQTLDVLVFEVIEPADLRQMVETLMEFIRGGNHELRIPGMHRLRCKELLIETTPSVELTLDGELRSRTPATVRVAPQGVPIMLPRSAHTAKTTGE